jgi:rubrerythrin
MSQFTRAQLLSAAGSLVLSADADLAKVAATAELLAIDFYKHAIASRHFKGDEREYLAAARDNEIEHYDQLEAALGKATPHGPRFRYPNGVFTSRTSVATLGQALETAFLGTYLGAVGSFKSNALKSLAGQIAATESRHLGVMTNIAAGAIVPAPDLPRVYTGVEALAALKPFMA